MEKKVALGSITECKVFYERKHNNFTLCTLFVTTSRFRYTRNSLYEKEESLNKSQIDLNDIVEKYVTRYFSTFYFHRPGTDEHGCSYR